MANLFEPPIMPEGPAAQGHRLFAFYRRFYGITVLKYANGTYNTGRYFSQDDLLRATVVYTGGHQYLVDDTEAAALTAAGFTVTTITTNPGYGLSGYGSIGYGL